MKTAIFIDEGVTQLIITPESAFEKRSLKLFARKDLSVNILQGQFYTCSDGWNRQTYYFGHTSKNPQNESLMLKISEEKHDNNNQNI